MHKKEAPKGPGFVTGSGSSQNALERNDGVENYSTKPIGSRMPGQPRKKPCPIHRQTTPLQVDHGNGAVGNRTRVLPIGAHVQGP